jgi:SOS-response transcriptional repressor LexA
MPAAVVSIGAKRTAGANRRASWAVFEIAQPGHGAVPYGILLADEQTGELTFRLRDKTCFEDLEEQETDLLDALSGDLEQKGHEMGGLRLLDSFEDSLSNFFRISDRSAIVYSGDARATVSRLFDNYVDSTIGKFKTHLPVYSLRAAATNFGESMEHEQDTEEWVRVPENLRLKKDMFIAYVEGRSMEPLIPDGSACIFRAPVTGSRKGRMLLIEQFGETDFASRYTVKRYARSAPLVEGAERSGAIRLEPLNPAFPAFDLTADKFRVIAEFVQVLPY